MKALTVQQPWASVMFFPELTRGGLVKGIENRTQLWKHRGPLAIHAGARVSTRGLHSPLVGRGRYDHVQVIDYEARAVWLEDEWVDEDGRRLVGTKKFGARLTLGAIIGLVDLVDVHVATPEHVSPDGRRVDFCCDSPWAETSYAEHRAGQPDRTRRDVVHLVLERPRALAVPVPCRGALGLWTVPSGVDNQVGAQLEAVTG